MARRWNRDASARGIEDSSRGIERPKEARVMPHSVLRFWNSYLGFISELSARPNCFNPIRLRPQKNIADNAAVERLSNAIAGNAVNVICVHVEIDIIPRACVRIHLTNY